MTQVQRCAPNLGVARRAYLRGLRRVFVWRTQCAWAGQWAIVDFPRTFTTP